MYGGPETGRTGVRVQRLKELRRTKSEEMLRALLACKGDVAAEELRDK